MDLFKLLPLLEGWSYVPKWIEQPTTITTQSTYQELVRFKGKKGWLLFVMAMFNNPTGELYIHIRDATNQPLDLDVSPVVLNALGVNAPNPLGMYCPIYNAILNHYGVAYMPGPASALGFIDLELGFNTMIQAAATAVGAQYGIPGLVAAPVTLIGFSSASIVIQDEKVFRESLAKVTKGEV